MRLWLERRASPIGEMLIVSDDDAVLRALDFADYEERLQRLLRLHYRHYSIGERRVPAAIARALDAYFAGDLSAIDAVPVATGGTGFQRSVWAALRSIPAGSTATYGAISRGLGMPRAFRAVGMANGANPIAIVVPCHRVIGSDGSLAGYGGGIHRKRWLLEHEALRGAPSTVGPCGLARASVVKGQ